MKKLIVGSTICCIALFYSPPVQRAILYTTWDASSFSAFVSSLGEFWTLVGILTEGYFGRFFVNILCWIGDIFAIGK